MYACIINTNLQKNVQMLTLLASIEGSGTGKQRGSFSFYFLYTKGVSDWTSLAYGLLWAKVSKGPQDSGRAFMPPP